MVKKLKSAQVCGFTFQAETVAQAKAEGESAMIRFAREANNGPSMIKVHDMLVLVWPNLTGWEYRVLDGQEHSMDGRGGIPGYLHANCSYGAPDRATACLEAIYAAAQRQWTHGVVDDAAWFAAAFGALRNVSGVGSKINALISGAAFQRRYQAGLAVCGDNIMAYDNAQRTRTIEECENLCRRELV
jgi:hypothetical protein